MANSRSVALVRYVGFDPGEDRRIAHIGTGKSFGFVRKPGSEESRPVYVESDHDAACFEDHPDFRVGWI